LQAVKKNPLGKNPGDVWAINTDKFPEEHFAIFPKELVRRIIEAACPGDGVILDHFAGSGTTGKVAMALGRKSIMIDINPNYAKIMQRRFIQNENTL
jgi:DNA modification methylase